jgi:hypothetical protein
MVCLSVSLCRPLSAHAQYLRKRIEEHFEDVKEATETQDEPRLPSDLADWAVVLCDEVCGLVREVPPSLKMKLAPVHRYLSHFGERLR